MESLGRRGARMSECRISETIENNPRGKRDGNINRITEERAIGHTARVPVASQPVARAKGGGHLTLCIGKKINPHPLPTSNLRPSNIRPPVGS